MTFCAPQFKAEYLTECLLEVVNDQWKVNAIESGRSFYHKAPAKGIRFYIESLAENPEIVDPYGSFLYVR